MQLIRGFGSERNIPEWLGFSTPSDQTVSVPRRYNVIESVSGCLVCNWKRYIRRPTLCLRMLYHLVPIAPPEYRSHVAQRHNVGTRYVGSAEVDTSGVIVNSLSLIQRVQAILLILSIY